MKIKLFKKVAALVTLMGAALGWKEEVPVENGKLKEFSEEQKELLKKAFGTKINLDEAIEAVNKELASIKNDAIEGDQKLIDAREEIKQMLKEHGLSQEDVENLAKVEGVQPDALEEIKSMVQKFTQDTDAKLKKLMDEAVSDKPQETLKHKDSMEHSKTHLWGDNKNELNAFEGRPWNQRAAGHISKPTDFSAADSTEIQKLKDDVALYYRQNPTDVKSLFRDTTGLPSFWPRRTNITDKFADGNIVSAEITQARKKGWLPKNKQLIQPEENQIFPVQVDIEHSGFELQKIEASWLNMMNKEGSQPFKMTFVKFLLQELDKKARQEDRIVATKGVHVKTPDNATIPGLAIHRGDGIFIKLWRAVNIDKKVTFSLIGNPTSANIVDYVKNLIDKNIPEEEKNNEGLVLYMSKSWLRAHVERKRVLFGLDNNYTGQELLEIENYPNVKICALHDLEGTDCMFITYDNVIETYENVPGEKSMYNFDSLKRDLYIFADYKWGAGFTHLGTKTKDGDPDAFKVQTVWTNGLSPFKDSDDASRFYVRMYDDATGEIALPYKNITVTDDWATDITDLSGVPEGTIVRIKGNTSLAASKYVVDDGNITLAGDANWDIKSGGILTLRANVNGATFTEVKRTVTAPTTPDSNVEFDGPTFDAGEGYVFNYTGGIDQFEEITGGVEGQQIVVHGSAAGALTFVDVAGNINVGAGAVLADENDNITLTKIDGVWEEVARTIA